MDDNNSNLNILIPFVLSVFEDSNTTDGYLFDESSSSSSSDDDDIIIINNYIESIKRNEKKRSNKWCYNIFFNNDYDNLEFKQHFTSSLFTRSITFIL